MVHVMSRSLIAVCMASVSLGFVAMPHMAMAATAAATDWKTTKVGAGSAGAYCAVSRGIGDTIITVGQTLSHQSSIALEMKSAKLDPAKTYRVSLKPGNADRIDIETKPINDTTFVMNMDRVVDVPKALSAQPTIQLGYDGASRALAVTGWESGAKALETCLASLDAGVPAPVVTGDVSKDIPTKPTMPSAAPTPVTKSVMAPVPVVAAPNTARLSELEAQIAALRAENNKLKAANADIAGASVAANTLRTERDTAQADLKKAQAELGTLRAAQGAASETGAKLTTTQNELAKAQAELATLRASQGATTKVSTDMTQKIETLSAQIATLQAENKTLKEQGAGASADKTLIDQLTRENAALKKAAAEKPVVTQVDPAQTQQIATLTKDLDAVRAENDTLKAKVGTYENGPKTADMDALRVQMEGLTKENIKLRGDLAAATNKTDDVKVSVAAEQPLREQLRTLKADNAALRARADELGVQLETKQKGDEKTLIAASGKNWDLEQATRRLQESEREVQRLSLGMREQRAKCEAEKKEIEYMLFDPKLAKEGQIALLNSLEDRIAQLQGTSPGGATASGVTPSQVAAAPVAPVVSAPIVSAPVAAAPALAAAPVVTPLTPKIATETLAAPAPATGYQIGRGSDALKTLLNGAGVAPSNTLAAVAKNPFSATGKAWAWENGSLAGMAVQDAGVKLADFDGTVSARMQTLKTACKGDFAAQPANDRTANGVRYAAYDAACIAGANSTSAAVLFVQQGDTFTTISHEAAPDDMTAAMDARDKLITTIAGK